MRFRMTDKPVPVTGDLRPPPPPETHAADVKAFAPCRVCGGAVGPKSAYWGPWRLHPSCPNGDPVRRLELALVAHGIPVERSDVLLLSSIIRIGTYSEGHREPTWARGESSQPWSHVSTRMLRKAVKELPRLRRDHGLTETTCTTGVCAWCGVAKAKAWHDDGHHWANGQPALCGGCHEAYRKAGSPSVSFWDDQRAGVASALTGVPPMSGVGAPQGVKAFAETNSEPTGQAWGHLNAEAVEEFRWSQWGRYEGKYAPPEQRLEALERARVKAMAQAARSEAQRAEEAAKVDVFGFGS